MKSDLRVSRRESGGEGASMEQGATPRMALATTALGAKYGDACFNGTVAQHHGRPRPLGPLAANLSVASMRPWFNTTDGRLRGPATGYSPQLQWDRGSTPQMTPSARSRRRPVQQASMKPRHNTTDDSPSAASLSVPWMLQWDRGPHHGRPRSVARRLLMPSAFNEAVVQHHGRRYPLKTTLPQSLTVVLARGAVKRSAKHKENVSKSIGTEATS